MSHRERRRPSGPSPKLDDGPNLACPRCKAVVAILTPDGVRARNGNPLGITEQIWSDDEGGLRSDGINVRCGKCGATSRWDDLTGAPIQ